MEVDLVLALICHKCQPLTDTTLFLLDCVLTSRATLQKRRRCLNHIPNHVCNCLKVVLCSLPKLFHVKVGARERVLARCIGQVKAARALANYQSLHAVSLLSYIACFQTYCLILLPYNIPYIASLKLIEVCNLRLVYLSPHLL